MSTRSGLPLLGAGKGRRLETRARQRLERELAAGHEHPERAEERLGLSCTARPEGPVIWLHAGDEIAALDHISLIERLRLEREELRFLVTTTRYDPATLLDGQLPACCTHQYLPYDERPGLERMLAHWRPDACIWVESELNPAVVEALQAQAVPVFWANATMPDEKSTKLRWFPGTARRVLGYFAHILATDGRSARNLRRLGVAKERLEVLGRLQDGPVPLECIESEREMLARLLATRPVWVAAHISTAEEPVVIGAHRHVSRRAHRYLLIVMPAHAQRGATLAAQLEHDGWNVALRSTDQEPGEDTQIFVADQPGEFGLMLRLAPITYIGATAEGSDRQPDDPFQVAALGSAVLHGPETGVFSSRFARLRNAGAARLVRSEAELARELEHLLAPDKVAEMAQAAWDVTTCGAGVTERLCVLVHDALDERGV